VTPPRSARRDERTFVAKPWFRPKQYGWGYTPQTWQGWAILVVVIAAVVIVVRVLRGS
jgi:hypothetical protein